MNSAGHHQEAAPQPGRRRGEPCLHLQQAALRLLDGAGGRPRTGGSADGGLVSIQRRAVAGERAGASGIGGGSAAGGCSLTIGRPLCQMALNRQTGSARSPGVYVRRSGDRLCEPRFKRSTALSGVRVHAQDYLGAGIVPTPQPEMKVDAEHSARVSDPAGLLL